ncbi:MAG: Rpn family recombination-promoting nuclease/putative transposase [Moorea sp. SIO4E2]|uniref:Rpn family recombination-promoting nuclease/putative transposase n=1 Tax=Moorena sp. SIO4E2 TaxID=2607826 RepID=UPI0013B6D156|nr:Rpn family recombination-promoting nuclease/putative transposase [Moorena sp. SIO4E2]NEQ07722.1 Rpn family recombination-promoting nuclease/putative transposase [Moorena sp. SIO4E2]
MRTDRLFYKVFQTLPGTFFELLEENSQLAQNYNFKAVELKELAKRTDGVFLPKRDGDPIYFVEVQFQKDEDLYYRLMQEVFVYLGQNRWRHGWQAVVFWAKRSLDTGIPRCYDAEVQTGYLRSIYLDETPDTSDSIGLGLVRLVVEPQANVQHRVKQLERCARALPVAQQRNAIELIEQALVYKFPERPWRELEAMFGLTEWKQTRFYQEVNAEGRITEAQILVMRLLKKRFPEKTEEINNVVQGLSLSNLEGLTDIIFELKSWEDFLSWLSQLDQ